jgi:hypothetical protein
MEPVIDSYKAVIKFIAFFNSDIIDQSKDW